VQRPSNQVDVKGLTLERSALIVDDDSVSTESLTKVLGSAGYQTATARCGVEASAKLRVTIPSLVIAAAYLPDMVALELLHNERSRGNNAPFVIIGPGDVRAAVQAVKRGAADYVEKPVNSVTIVEVANHAIGGADNPQPQPVAHSARRLTKIIVPILEMPADPKTLNAWARHVGISTGALRTVCHTARVAPNKVLRFGRVLRAVIQQGDDMRAEDMFDIVDLRTLGRLLRLGNRDGAACFRVPRNVEAFLRQQSWIVDGLAIAEIRKEVQRVQASVVRVEPGVRRRPSHEP
jgi:ActR/RegA family two-component response regulator